ncbi:GerAB/ArcD/ProY family transporter [Peribacillus frigoritolerans]|uniref:GerAB/ArcD/ProY family transporter n=1 Tax=Peribacillus castrilensis TaxID=2897690 RepID=UPI002DCE3FB4|nr:GerAB/ArcD/ProY family transporter [Peribacillus castrilensis]
MEIQKLKKLHSVHVIFLIINTTTGVGMFTFPHDVSQVGYGVWVMPLVYGVVIQLLLLLFFRLLKYYPDHNLFEINTLLLGKVAGNFINFMIFIYAILVIFHVIKSYVHIVTLLAFQFNPTFWIITALLFVTFSIVSKGNIISLAQYHILSFFLSIWFILFLSTGFNKGDITHLLPLLNFTASDLLDAFPKGYFSFIGFEFILFFYPLINNQERAFKHTSIGLWVVVFLHCFVTIAAVIHYTDWELKHIQYPIVNFMQEVQFSFAVRIDNVFINLWLLLVVGTAAAYTWIAKNALDHISRNEKNENTKVLSALGVVFVLLFLPGSSGEAIGKIADGVIYFNFVLVVFPLLLLVIRRVKS